MQVLLVGGGGVGGDDVVGERRCMAEDKETHTLHCLYIVGLSESPASNVVVLALCRRYVVSSALGAAGGLGRGRDLEPMDLRGGILDLIGVEAAAMVVFGVVKDVNHLPLAIESHVGHVLLKELPQVLALFRPSSVVAV